MTVSIFLFFFCLYNFGLLHTVKSGDKWSRRQNLSRAIAEADPDAVLFARSTHNDLVAVGEKAPCGTRGKCQRFGALPSQLKHAAIRSRSLKGEIRYG